MQEENKKEEDDEDLQDLFDWLDMQPWSDEDGLPYGDMELRRPAR